MQLQPVDSGTLSDIKAKPEAKGLFASSAIFNTEWSSKSFSEPILVCDLSDLAAQREKPTRLTLLFLTPNMT